jgi:hypothetical protein|tara:strand:+ start:398 stop:544 length:147 start_codon:yes stop_codon:yes gene_type:complete
MDREDLIEEMYNQVIQEESHLQYKTIDEELHEKIMEIVEKRINNYKNI